MYDKYIENITLFQSLKIEKAKTEINSFLFKNIILYWHTFKFSISSLFKMLYLTQILLINDS